MAKKDLRKEIVKALEDKKTRFIIGCEDLEDGMIIEAKDLDDAVNYANSMLDIHEVDENDEIID